MLVTIDQWNVWSIAIVFFILGLFSIGIPLFRFGWRLWQDHQSLQTDYQLAHYFLDEEKKCWWSLDSQDLYMSRSLIHLLKLNPNATITLQDIPNQFLSQDAYKLNHLLQELQRNKTSFDKLLRLNDEKTLLKIQGNAFLFHGQPYFALHMKDMTHEKATKDQLKQQISTLTEQCDWYQHLTNNIPLVLWGRDSSLNLTYCNQVYAGILDSEISTVLQEGRELIESQRHKSPYQLAQKAIQTNQLQSMKMHIVIDGHRRLIEVTEIPLENPTDITINGTISDGTIASGTIANGTIGYATDLTDLEEVVSTLSKHVSAHQEVLHNLSTSIGLYGSDTRLEFFNTAYQKLFGFEEKWLYQKPLYVEVLQDLRERRKLPEYIDFTAFKQSQLQLFDTLMEPFQELINQPDGRILRMMVVPQPLGGLLYMFDDVTDKIAMERRYNTLIAVQKETIDHLYEGIVVLGSDNRLRLSNSAVAKLWNINPIELLPNRHAGEIMRLIRHMFKGFSEWDEFRQKILLLFNLRQPVTDRTLLKDDLMIQYSYVPLPDGSHLLSFIDVSDRWRFEQALRERNQALEHADRFKSDFISHVSYELRAPLNMIIGFSEILLNQYFGDLNERQMDYAHSISDSSQRLLTLINDIIDLASVEAGQLNLKIQPIRLENFLSSLTRFIFNRSNDHGVQISCKNETNIDVFLGDERRLKQVFFNLLINAIRFTPAGGRIDLIVTVENEQTEPQLCFSIHDTGVGIDEKKRQEIYHMFNAENPSERTSSQVTGIGLHLVKSFIELHEGHVSMHSTPDKGTSVVCRIPLLKEHIDIDTPIPTSETHQTSSQEWAH